MRVKCTIRFDDTIVDDSILYEQGSAAIALTAQKAGDILFEMSRDPFFCASPRKVNMDIEIQS